MGWPVRRFGARGCKFGLCVLTTLLIISNFLIEDLTNLFTIHTKEGLLTLLLKARQEEACITNRFRQTWVKVCLCRPNRFQEDLLYFFPFIL